MKDLQDTACMLTGPIAMQDPVVQFFTLSDSDSDFHLSAVLFNFELFALEAILSLLIFMF